MDERRSERVSERIREELHEILNYELSYPRIGGVSIVEVLLSPDARRVRIRVALSGGPDEQDTCLAALRKAKSHIRRLLADRIDIFRIPDLEFEKDIDVDSDARLKSLMRRVRRGRPRDETVPERSSEE